MSLLGIFLAAMFVPPQGALAASCYDPGTGFTTDVWQYCIQPDSKVVVYYGVSADGSLLKLGMHSSNLSGWSSLAFGGNGGMKGAKQFVVRKATNGSWIAEGRYSTDYVTPMLDATQNIRLMFATNVGNDIVWGVLLPSNSCDPNGYPIENFTRWMHWARGSSHDFAYHTDRGQFEVNLFSAPPLPFSARSNLTATALMPNASIIAATTASSPANPYICTVFDIQQLLPSLNFSQKQQIVQFLPYVQHTTQDYIHHMILFSCEKDTARSENFAHLQMINNCESMPSGCSIKWAWAKGGQAINLPPDVGMPFGSGQTWLVLQMHYYNPQLVPGLVDSSGVQLILSAKPLPVDADMFIVNAGTSADDRPPLTAGMQNLQIPDLVVPSACTSKWTQPIHVVGLGHHEHLTGTHMEINVHRDGQHLGMIRREHVYDFKHQSFSEVSINILYPGDSLQALCTYDTSSRSSPTIFGEGSQDEMCFAAFMYYPAQAMNGVSYKDTTELVEWGTSCLTPGDGENKNISQAAEIYLTNPLGYKQMSQYGSYDLATLCGLVTDGTPWPDACPPCYLSKTCAPSDFEGWAQFYSSRDCENGPGVAAYPQNSTAKYTSDHGIACEAFGETYFRSNFSDAPPSCEKLGNITSPTANAIVAAAVQSIAAARTTRAASNSSASYTVFSHRVSALWALGLCSLFKLLATG